MSELSKLWTSVEYNYYGLSDEWFTSVEQEDWDNYHQTGVINRGRFQDPTIPNDVNASDSTNIPLN